DDAGRPFVGSGPVPEPDVAAPRKPEHHEDRERLEQPQPAGIVVQEAGHLRDREDEDEVEEELEGRHPLLALDRGLEVLVPRQLVQRLRGSRHGARYGATSRSRRRNVPSRDGSEGTHSGSTARYDSGSRETTPTRTSPAIRPPTSPSRSPP